MDKKSPKVILLLQNSEPFLFGCQKILKCIPYCHYIYEGLLLNMGVYSSCGHYKYLVVYLGVYSALSLHLRRITSLNFCPPETHCVLSLSLLATCTTLQQSIKREVSNRIVGTAEIFRTTYSYPIPANYTVKTSPIGRHISLDQLETRLTFLDQ